MEPISIDLTPIAFTPLLMLVGQHGFWLGEMLKLMHGTLQRIMLSEVLFMEHLIMIPMDLKLLA